MDTKIEYNDSHKMESSKLWQGTKQEAKIMAAQDGLSLVALIDKLVKQEKIRRAARETGEGAG